MTCKSADKKSTDNRRNLSGDQAEPFRKIISKKDYSGTRIKIDRNIPSNLEYLKSKTNV